MSGRSTDTTGFAPNRTQFAQHAHAEAHAILALRNAYDRIVQMRTVDEALADLRADIAYRAGRLGRDPDVLCDELERARLEMLADLARSTGAAMQEVA